MPPSRDEDLDWLYGRPRERSEPEPTRVMPGPLPQPQPDPAARGAGYGGAPRDVPPHHPGTPGVGAAPGQQRPSGPPPWETPDGRGPGGPPVPPAPPLRTRRRRRPVRSVVRVVAVLLALAAVWFLGVPAYAWTRVGRVDDVPGGERPAQQPGQTFLLVGSDSRAGLSKAEQKRLGTGSTEGQRTDTMMLLHVPVGGRPVLISIPRDSYVAIPGNGRNKINAAFAFGGAQLLEQTVEQSTGLRVDGYLEIGFGGFVDVIDALDGIRMCLPEAIEDTDSHLDLPKGCQDLGGTDALGYVRMRKADPRGDLGRVERQRQMLAAVAAKAASPATLLDPVRYWRLNDAGARSVRVGEDTSLWEMGALGLGMRKVAAGDGLTLTVPISDADARTPVGSAVLWDEKKAGAMFADVARGDTTDLQQYAE